MNLTTALRRSTHALVLAMTLVLFPITNVQAARPDASDAPLSDSDQLAIAALRSLFSLPPEQAMPRLRKVLTGAHDDAVKARALVVLAQVDSTEAGPLLAEIARTGSPRLQRDAIRALAIRGDAASLDTIRQLATNVGPETRNAVREAMVIAQDKAGLVQWARTAANEEDRQAALDALAAIGAVDELRSLAKDGGVSRSLMLALAIAGDHEALLAIVRGNEPIETRAEAIQHLGIVQQEQGRAALRALYDELPEPELKQKVMHALVIAGDDTGLLDLYRRETDPAMKRHLLHALSMTGSDAAMEAIDAAIEGRSP